MTVKWRLTWIVLGTYILGATIGAIAGWRSHIHLISHPHVVPALDIIQHNLGVVALMLLGLISFGVVSLGILFINGLMLGILLAGYSLQGKLAGLLLFIAPYGFLEVGAFMLACYANLFLAPYIWTIFKRESTEKKKRLGVIQRWCVMTVIALLMLGIAGFLERMFFFLTV
jgi:uncharacterized membrane protein SpoIIM required for sporulation